MPFTQKKIAPKIIWIIDIWSYKIRVWICKIYNNELNLIWYWEKRQNTDDIVMHEFVNLEWICENINAAIDKAENDSGTKIHDIIINIPFEEIFFETSKINHIRSNPKTEISRQELTKIMEDVETQALKKHYKHIRSTSGYTKKDTRLIIWGVSEIKIDKEKTKKLLKLSPKEVNISLLNIFIPEAKYETIQTIWRVLGKNIKKIIPTEFAITKLFKRKQDVVVIDLWSTQTSIIVKKENKIVWVQKHAFWIDSLIKKIRQNYNRTKIEIINTIDQNIYELEKQEFLEIFENILVISLEEILWETLCPSDFFMIGWGSGRPWGPARPFFKQKTAYEIGVRLVGSEMCIRDRYNLVQ